MACWEELMSMDVYHQILLKLHEATGGSEKKIINLADLIRKEGFGGAMDDVFDYMSREGWIAEARGEGMVRITHWGVEEVRRATEAKQPGDREALQNAAREARKAAERARELADLCEEYADCLSKADPQGRASKLHRSALNKLKALNEALAPGDKRA